MALFQTSFCANCNTFFASNHSLVRHQRICFVEDIDDVQTPRNQFPDVDVSDTDPLSGNTRNESPSNLDYSKGYDISQSRLLPNNQHEVQETDYLDIESNSSSRDEINSTYEDKEEDNEIDDEYEDIDEPENSNEDEDFQPFTSKALAILFVLLFGCKRRMSIQQMKVLWVVFKALDINVPSLRTVLRFRDKFGGIQSVRREVRPGVVIHVRPIPELIRTVFGQATDFIEGLWKWYFELATDVLHYRDKISIGNTRFEIHSFSPDASVVILSAGEMVYQYPLTEAAPLQFEAGPLSKR
ncbi:hypothetical protein HDU99_000662, partial [Rhizoclosmatium hyalinum]